MGNSLFSQAPSVHWKTIDHAPIYFWTGQFQTHENSGEDWWYDIESSFTNTEVQNGYVTCGYATWVNYFEDETNFGGCFAESTWGGFLTPSCDMFETAEPLNIRGSSRGTFALYDLEGKMVWCRAPNSGVLNSVKQLDDKSGYIATGWTFSTLRGGLNENYTGPLLHNPTSTSSGFDFTLNCNSSLKWGRKLNVIKTDNEGNVVWNYTYSPFDPNVFFNEAYEVKTEGWDIHEVSNGFLISGSISLNSNDNSYVIKIDDQGRKINEITWLENNDGFESVAKSIDINGNHIVVAGEEGIGVGHVNVYAYLFLNENDLFNQNQQWHRTFSYSDQIYTTLQSIYSSKLFYNYDVEFDNSGNIILPITGFKNSSFSGGSSDLLKKAVGLIHKLNPANGNDIITNGFYSVGDIAAYDLIFGVTPTSDGGFAVVSSKQPNPVTGQEEDISELMEYWISNYPDYCNVFNKYSPEDDDSPYKSWNTDAYIAKFDASANLQWEKTFDIHDGPREAFPGDLKKQECLYNITQAQDGGLVICGNNSRNFDDNYLVKLHDDCAFTEGIDYNIDPLAEDEAENEFFVISTANSNTPYTISSNTKVKAHIVVGDGGLLRITNGAKVEFADSKQVGHQSRITVEEDGVLDIIHGTLTSLDACPNAMWDGVNVLGNPNIEQDFNGQHGYVGMIDGATIENARVAILADHVIYDSEMNFSASSSHAWAGGIVQSNGGTIKNSRNGIIFYPFDYSRDHPTQTLSEIKNTSFVTDAPLNGSLLNSTYPEGVGTYGHLHIWDYHGLNLTGNTFDNQIDFHPEHRGTGILTFDAHYSVKCNTTDVDGNCTSGPNVFKNLTFGVEAHNISTIYNHDIDGNTFENCRFAIAGYNTWLSRYVRNNIEMEGITYNSASYSHTGILQYGSELFKIEQNTITNPNNVTISGGAINIVNSNNSADEIYRNNIEYTVSGVSVNGSSSYNSNEGLVVKCNQFQGDGTHLNYTISLVEGTMYEDQGLCEGLVVVPAGNIFNNCGTSGNNLDFEIYSTTVAQDEITYHHHSNTSSFKLEPDCYESRLDLNPCAGTFDFEVACPTQVNDPHPEGKTDNPEALAVLKAEFYQHQMQGLQTQIDLAETAQEKNYFTHQQNLVKKEMLRNLIANNQTEQLANNLNLKTDADSRLLQHINLTQTGQLAANEQMGVLPQLVNLVVENNYPNVEVVKSNLVEAQIRALANADAYGNLKAKSYLRLALQEPIIPEMVFEVFENSKSKNFSDLTEDIKNEFSIFPNPSSNGLFNLTLPMEASKIELIVFNNLGQNVHTETLQYYLATVNLNHLKPGIYYFKINFQLGNNLATENTKVLITND